MKIKYLKRNLQNTKKELKRLAKDYKVRIHWEELPNKPEIIVEFEKKYSSSLRCIKIIVLPADKIAFGKYRPPMVRYNLERSLVSWLHRNRVDYGVE